MPGPREIFDCGRVRSYLESYLEGQVPPPEARAIRLHFERCRDCWPLVMEREPLQYFSPLADQEPPGELFEGMWSSIREEIRRDRDAPVRPGFLSGLVRPSFAWAAAAALLIIAAAALARPWLPEWSPAGPPPAAAAGEPPGRRGLPGDVVHASAPSLPTVQEVRSPTAQVLSMKVYGEDEAVTEVVLIVDPETEL